MKNLMLIEPDGRSKLIPTNLTEPDVELFRPVTRILCGGGGGGGGGANEAKVDRNVFFIV